MKCLGGEATALFVHCKRFFSQKILFRASSALVLQNFVHLFPSLLLFYSELLVYQFSSGYSSGIVLLANSSACKIGNSLFGLKI